MNKMQLPPCLAFGLVVVSMNVWGYIFGSTDPQKIAFQYRPYHINHNGLMQVPDVIARQKMF